VSRTSDARELLNNRLFGEIKETMENSIFDQWKNSTNVEEREVLFNKMAILDEIVSEFNLKVLETSDGN